jgi:hypothetical protein
MYATKKELHDKLGVAVVMVPTGAHMNLKSLDPIRDNHSKIARVKSLMGNMMLRLVANQSCHSETV